MKERKKIMVDDAISEGEKTRIVRPTIVVPHSIVLCSGRDRFFKARTSCAALQPGQERRWRTFSPQYIT